MTTIAKRHLIDHIVDQDKAEQLGIVVLDELGPGGAHHLYAISLDAFHPGLLVSFQKGPIGEVGLNGVSHEALLAIVIDRLRCFQEGPYASEYNRLALVHLRQGLDCLKRRTAERLERGVEGTSVA